MNNGVVSTSPDGSQVVLARFPEEGKTLSAFGLTPSRISHLAIPNNLSSWPTTALRDCINIEMISVYGSEVDEEVIDLELSHGFRNLTKLTTLKFPSTIRTLGNGVNGGKNGYYGIFPTSLRSVFFSKNLLSIGSSFPYCSQITHVDLSCCSKLTILGNTDRGGDGPFFECTQLRTVFFPPSLKTILNYSFAEKYDVNDLLSNLRVLAWVGRTTRASNIALKAFCGAAPLDQLVASGRITELFIP